MRDPAPEGGPRPDKAASSPAARLKRRMAAILAADVVGYTRLMERDEAGTLERLKAHRKELIDPLVAEHRGRVVKLMGDGALCEFASVVDAVACAAAIQEGMIGRERDVLAAERIRFRIGVNLGDVIVEGDGDIYGDGVNVAARLEQLAEPGGIVVSGTTFDHLRGELGRSFASLGEQCVKNIERPVRAYRMVLPGGSARPLKESALPDVRGLLRLLAHVPRQTWGSLLLAALVAAGAVWTLDVSGPGPTIPVPTTPPVLRPCNPPPDFNDLSLGERTDWLLRCGEIGR